MRRHPHENDEPIKIISRFPPVRERERRKRRGGRLSKTKRIKCRENEWDDRVPQKRSATTFDEIKRNVSQVSPWLTDPREAVEMIASLIRRRRASSSIGMKKKNSDLVRTTNNANDNNDVLLLGHSREMEKEEYKKWARRVYTW